MSTLVSFTGFATTLSAPMTRDQLDLSLTPAITAWLIDRLGTDGYAYLTISDSLGAEVVKVSTYGGALVVDRHQNDTAPRAFPKGACVDARMTEAAVKDLICNYDCCAGDCPCEAVQAAGTVIPPAQVGSYWEGSVVFTGTTPIALGVNGAPSWMQVVSGAGFVKLAGVPTAAATYLLSVAATNCNGQVASQAVNLTIAN
jgi:hypothetical protein